MQCIEIRMNCQICRCQSHFFLFHFLCDMCLVAVSVVACTFSSCDIYSLIQMPVTTTGWALLALFISVSVSSPLTRFLILSLSYGGCGENGCLIMQRGQPIKGPRPSDLKAYSEHSWRERERNGDSWGERASDRESESETGLIAVWRGSPLIHLPLVSFHQ